MFKKIILLSAFISMTNCHQLTYKFCNYCDFPVDIEMYFQGKKKSNATFTIGKFGSKTVSFKYSLVRSSNNYVKISAEGRETKKYDLPCLKSGSIVEFKSRISLFDLNSRVINIENVNNPDGSTSINCEMKPFTKLPK